MPVALKKSPFLIPLSAKKARIFSFIVKVLSIFLCLVKILSYLCSDFNNELKNKFMNKHINHRRGRQSEEALSLLIRRSSGRLAALEQQRRNLLTLVCRTLQAAPGYKLRPSEFAVESVGDLSCLSQEAYASLLNRIERDYPVQTSRGGISPATPCCPCMGHL